jgi:hypothetical protein
MKFHGILTIQDKDKVGEVVEVAGCDLKPLRERALVTLEFGQELANVIGHVTAVEAVTEPDSEPDPELRGLANGKPFIKVEVEIPALERTRGRALADIIARDRAHELPPSYYFAIEGTAMGKKAQPDGSFSIGSCVVQKVSIVQHGVHAAQKLIPGPLKNG